MDIYRELILDHYKNPRNFGHLDHPDEVAEEINVSCGDRIVIELRTTHNSQLTTIRDIRFSGEGCAISQASASMLTEKIKGLPIDTVMKFNLRTITDMLGTTLTPLRVKCATLPLEVVQKAIYNNLRYKNEL